MNGFVLFKKHKDEVYKEMLLGNPFDFQYWIDHVKNGDVYFDSGMYEGNN